MKRMDILSKSLNIFKPIFILFLFGIFLSCGERIFDNPFDPQASKREFTVLSVLNISLILPRDLTWDGSTLWIIDEAVDTIYSINKYSGSVIRSLKSPLPQASGLIYDGSGLWVSSYQSIQLVKINIISGEVLRRVNIQKGKITSLAYDGEKLWGYDKISNKIYRIDQESGQILKSINNPGFSFGGMEIFNDSIWITDPNNFSIYQLSMEGDLISTYSAPGQSPWGITFDGFYVWNVDSNRKIYQLSY